MSADILITTPVREFSKSTGVIGYSPYAAALRSSPAAPISSGAFAFCNQDTLIELQRFSAESKYLRRPRYSGWLSNCLGQSMRKPSLTNPDGAFAGCCSDRTNSLEKVAGDAGLSGQRCRLHLRFNPSAVGFGILDSANHVVDNSRRTDTATISADHRSLRNSEEGK